MIPGKYIIKSYAKINLHLEVLNKRSDNYHNLFSLMAELELSDLLKLECFNLNSKRDHVTVEIINKGGHCSSILGEIPPEKNFITIAVKNYMHLTGTGGQFRFSIEKNIPSGAGLGGGSSNAAAALLLTAEALGRKIDDDIRAAAYMTGSDVPFFLTGGFAFVEGQGELVFPTDLKNESYILLVNNGIHIDTGLAYRNLNRTLSCIPPEHIDRKEFILENIKSILHWKNLFRNDFEESIFRTYPEIGLIKEKMYSLKSYFTAMTGSGSTVFGLFTHEELALNAQFQLEKEGNIVYFTKFRDGRN